jgi:hypothetical protein
MEASQNLADSNLSFSIIVSSTLASFHTISICNMKNWSIQDYPIQPIDWVGRGQVTISKLNRDLIMTLKSESSINHPNGTMRIVYLNFDPSSEAHEYGS